LGEVGEVGRHGRAEKQKARHPHGATDAVPILVQQVRKGTPVMLLSRALSELPPYCRSDAGATWRNVARTTARATLAASLVTQ
jgi:hypothetical protein